MAQKKYLSTDGLLYFWQKLKVLLSGKVDKETGKGLSTNDYTTAEKTKLAGLENYTHPTGQGYYHVPAISGSVDYNKFLVADGTTNSPKWVTTTSDGKGLSTNDYTTAEKNKLAGIATGANKTVVDSEFTEGGTNPVQGGIILTAIQGLDDEKVDKVTGTETNGYTRFYIVKPDGTASVINGKSDLAKNGFVPIYNSDGSLVGYCDDGSADDTLTTKAYADGLYDALSARVTSFYGEIQTVSKDLREYETTVESTYAKKTDIASVYRVKGSITYSNLIKLTTAEVGDVYNVTDKGGANYVCITAKTAGASSWDQLGETVDLSGYQLSADLVAITNAEIDTILAS